MNTASNRSPRNKILEQLPSTERQIVLSMAEQVRLRKGSTIVPPYQPFDHVYFPTDAVFSVLTDAATKLYIETGTIGCEGFVGIPAYLGAKAWPQRTIVQVPGSAHKIPVSKFTEVVRQAPTLTSLLNKYILAYMAHVSQTAACNGQHTISERCARWVLLTQDRLGGNIVPLTQQFLSYMLGVRRPSVTTAQADLKRRGLIRYNRGKIEVVDRPGLEAAACKCYSVVRDEFAALIGAPVG